MSYKPNVWPQSTCVECGRLIPNGYQQYCTMIGAGFCTHHFPAAVEERYNEMYAALMNCVAILERQRPGRHDLVPAHDALRHAKGEL